MNDVDSLLELDIFFRVNDSEFLSDEFRQKVCEWLFSLSSMMYLRSGIDAGILACFCHLKKFFDSGVDIVKKECIISPCRCEIDRATMKQKVNWQVNTACNEEAMVQIKPIKQNLTNSYWEFDPGSG